MAYDSLAALEKAAEHYQQAIRYRLMSGNVFGVAQIHQQMALMFERTHRLPDALEYARAAMDGYEGFGRAAAGKVREIRELIRRIEISMAGPSPGRADPP